MDWPLLSNLAAYYDLRMILKSQCFDLPLKLKILPPRLRREITDRPAVGPYRVSDSLPLNRDSLSPSCVFCLVVFCLVVFCLP